MIYLTITIVTTMPTITTIPNPMQRIITAITKSLIPIIILPDSWLIHTALSTNPPTCTLNREKQQLMMSFRRRMKLGKSPPQVPLLPQTTFYPARRNGKHFNTMRSPDFRTYETFSRIRRELKV
mmetsp:Transcript_2335/g.3714  ORF Transcript_2335/g.3714 Transcript_2335/m.3714 type:complete len:124 (-) Transcript_2335:1759-2130(-)